jgi:serine/threonine-protein kinase
MLLGTPAYMSPEKVMSARDVDERADLWSAGVMFYEMLTGRVAFPAPTEYARLTAVLTSDPEPIGRVDPSLAPFAAFLTRTLRKNRDERFPSALEMARALAACAPHAAVMPLSRLPDVPSVFAPLASPGAPSTARVGTTTIPSGVRAIALAEAGVSGERKAGGTLASPAPAQEVVEHRPQVVVISPQKSLDETLPSKDLPMIRGSIVRGVTPVVLVLLVLGALVAGFLLGWAFGRAP